MNERKRHMLNTSQIIRPPAFPIPGNKLFERIGSAVSASRGYALENRHFARMMDRSTSTTSHWFGAFSQPHLVCFFCLLEQLSPSERCRAVDSLCRELPTFDHPRLRHNPVALTGLKGLLAQDTGLTLVTGGTDEQRTFLLTALGHAFCRLDRQHRAAAGIDLHEPDWFVPVEGLFYLKGPADPVHADEPVRQTWPEIIRANEPLILLNGLWSAFPDLRSGILSLASRKHVVVADQQISVARAQLPVEHPLHIVSVSAVRENAGWIGVQTAPA